MTSPHHFILTLGSNTEAEAHIAFVRERLCALPHCSLRFSTPRLSAPVEFPLFAAQLKALEHSAGRTPEQRATSPEQIPIDIDLICWDDLVLKPRDLTRPYLHLGLGELGEQLPSRLTSCPTPSTPKQHKEK